VDHGGACGTSSLVGERWEMANIGELLAKEEVAVGASSKLVWLAAGTEAIRLAGFDGNKEAKTVVVIVSFARRGIGWQSRLVRVQRRRRNASGASPLVHTWHKGGRATWGGSN
jgi:hypothetical protein